jgi:ketosteroid isomerase-like protein
VRSKLLSVAALSVLATAAPSNISRTDDAGDVRAARAQQNEAIAARDLDRVASFWIDDVQVTAGLGFTLRGRDAYRRAFESDSMIVYRREPDNVQVNSHWPIAWETGSWAGRRAGQYGQALLGGRYSAQWVKQNGRWLIRSELFVALECSGAACAWGPRPE